MTQSTAIAGQRTSLDTFAALMMVLLTFSWGLNQVAMKVSNIGFNPIVAILLRSAIAAILVYGWCIYRRIRLFEHDGTFWPGGLVGACFALEFVLIFVGLDYTTAARGALMLYTMPFWVLIGAHFMLGERITGRKLIGLALAFAGVMLVFSDGLSAGGEDTLFGDLLCLAGGALWAATTLFIKSTRLSVAAPEKTLLYQLVVSALVVVPILPFAGPLIREPDALAVGSLVFQAVYVVAFTYVLWFWLMRVYPATGLSSFTFLTPVFGVLCGGLLLNEPLTMSIFGALALIVIGLFVVNRPARAPA